MKRTLILIITATTLVASSGIAMAANFDVALRSFIDATGDVDEPGFRAVSEGIALSMQPRWSGPANTMGSRGFDVGYNYLHTAIEDTEPHWKMAVPDRSLGGLGASQVHFRKGLPYSLELGGTVSSLHDSRLYGVGFELKLAVDLSTQTAARSFELCAASDHR